MTHESGEPAAVAFPSEESLAQKVSEHRRKPNVARVVSSSVSGCATLLFGALMGGLVVVAVSKGSLAAAFGALLFGGMTAGLAFLTWRWARGLPPNKQLASNDQEREALDP